LALAERKLTKNSRKVIYQTRADLINHSGESFLALFEIGFLK
jgi:hypothetical protein